MEWTVVTVMITLIGGIAILIKPIINLTQAITKLDMTCSSLDGQFSKFQADNTESHRRIWEHNNEQDKNIAKNSENIADHEARIHNIEQQKGKE
jgi:hypothetical protein